ncbi:adenosylcobinamide-GDP ribazoletransferase [Thermoproteus tenax]|uniref:Adenosylcobinamide-GDP ribazoletransferase n=1 Tax=Thermoproteus tenax (strain ATCC 35583 / DSM 2078 / JCM 9277 / NBRC 100435 / Kra 1) TaxID=768679 RepID=G4RLL1_THETK|nr:adenosylcobinamide-GDP ribazoletransferase [Thermoproteus tenax]CCC82456.1 cobalamin (5'-phosphate) synthase [Thermoproteus tenax Kra 1]
MRCLRALVSFFTIFPVKAELDFSCAWALPYVVAPLTGGLAALAFFYLGPLPSYLLLLLLTGLNHLDGLADTADALMVRERSRARQVLEDPRRGTAGIFAVVASVALALFYLKSPWQLLFAELFSKAVTVILASFSRPFKEGLGSTFIGSVKRKWPLAVPALAVVSIEYPWATLCSTALSLFFYYIAYKHLGGANGDVLGYLLELSRVFFIVSSARL